MPASTILLIEADAKFGETISSALTRVGYTVTTIADPNEIDPDGLLSAARAEDSDSAHGR